MSGASDDLQAWVTCAVAPPLVSGSGARVQGRERARGSSRTYPCAPSVSSDRGTEVRNNERRTLVPFEATNPVAIGIDAAVVAIHHVVVRRPGVSGAGETLEDFGVAPTLAGMEILTKRLSQ